MEVKLDPVMEYGKRQADAIGCLRQHGHIEPTLLLLYAAIDTMAWLSVPEEESTGRDFQTWVDKYMLGVNRALLPDVTAVDLWGARCGLLHTGAPESRDFRKGNARKIFYTSNVEVVAELPADVVLVSIENLGRAFAAALTWFIADLDGNAEWAEVARKKIGRILIHRAV
jgi:hypothetical protein